MRALSTNFRVNLRDGLSDELARGVAQGTSGISSAQQDSQGRFGDDDHGSTPLSS